MRRAVHNSNATARSALWRLESNKALTTPSAGFNRHCLISPCRHLSSSTTSLAAVASSCWNTNQLQDVSWRSISSSDRLSRNRILLHSSLPCLGVQHAAERLAPSRCQWFSSSSSGSSSSSRNATTEDNNNNSSYNKSENEEESEQPHVVQTTDDEGVAIEIPGAQTGGRKLAIVFTCTVCNTRSAKQFTEQAYNHGVVIVRCPGCANLHLIADRLGYFDDGDWDLNSILAKTGQDNVKTVTGDDVLELTLEDLVGKEKMEELLNEASTSSSTEAANDESSIETTVDADEQEDKNR